MRAGLAQKAGFPVERLNEIHGAWGDAKNPVLMMDDKLRDDLESWMSSWVDHCTCCLALGTSLCGMYADCVAEATAARHLAGGAGQHGLVIINLQPTPYDDRSSLRFWGVLDDVLKAIAKALRMSAPNKVAVARGQEWVRSHPNCTYNTPKRKTNAPL